MEDLEMLFVEIPKGSNKYEFSSKKNKWYLDRVLPCPMFYPGDYGFIPETIGGDGEEIDVICLMNYKSFPGCHVPIRIIGGLEMIDQEEKDDKIIAVNAVDNAFNNILSIENLDPSIINQINFFFKHYKILEGKKVEIKKIISKIEAIKLVKSAKEKWKKFNK